MTFFVVLLNLTNIKMAQDEQEQPEPVRQIYDPGFPAVSSRFRPLSAPRAYQGRSYVRASTGGQVRKAQTDEQETGAQSEERAERPARCASAPEKAFTYNVPAEILWKGEAANSLISTSNDRDRPPRNGVPPVTCPMS